MRIFAPTNNNVMKSISIINNSQRINKNNYLSAYCVPDSKSFGYLQQRAQHYKLRCYYESLQCKDEHGICLFDTLTYRDECLPTFKGIPCFCHEDIVKFRKRLRTNIERAGYILLDEDGQEYLRSFIVSEYGHTTKRPHYHIIVWCRAYKMVQETRIPITPFALHSLIHKSWQYGFTDRKIKQINLNGKGLGAIHYVTKYMTKDQAEVDALADDLKIACKSTYDTEEIEQIIKESKGRFRLRMWVSNGLGIYAVKKFYLDESFRKYFFNTGGCFPMPNAKGGVSEIPAGHYYIYKMFYDRVFNPATNRRDKFVLNDDGYYFKDITLEPKIDKLANNLSEGISCLTPSECRALDTLHADLLDLRHFAIYGMVYRNRVFTDIEEDGFYPFDYTNYHMVYIEGLAPCLQDTDNPCAQNYNVKSEYDSRETLRKTMQDHAYRWASQQNCEQMLWLETCYSILLRGVQRLNDEREAEQKRKFDIYTRLRGYKCSTEQITN